MVFNLFCVPHPVLIPDSALITQMYTETPVTKMRPGVYRRWVTFGDNVVDMDKKLYQLVINV